MNPGNTNALLIAHQRNVITSIFIADMKVNNPYTERHRSKVGLMQTTAELISNRPDGIGA